MCVIAVYSDNYPKLVDLESMEAFNSDGAGIAWIDRKTNKVEWVKGLKLSAKKIHKMITKKKIQLPFVIHFRISSVGKTNNELCHPFTLEKNDSNDLSGKTNEGVLFHNGTNTQWDSDLWQFCLTRNVEIPKGDMSDTRAMAYITAHLGSGYIENFCPQQDKYVIITPKGIRTFGHFYHDSNKNFVSNTMHDNTNVTTLFNSQTKSKKTIVEHADEYDECNDCCEFCLEMDEIKLVDECDEHWNQNAFQRAKAKYGAFEPY